MALVFVTTLMTQPSSAFVFDDMSKLAGETVIVAGDMQQLRCPTSGRYNCATWPREFYKIGNTCAELVGGYGTSYVNRGIVTINDHGQASIFTLSTIGASFKKATAALYDCPM